MCVCVDARKTGCKSIPVFWFCCHRNLTSPSVSVASSQVHVCDQKMDMMLKCTHTHSCYHSGNPPKHHFIPAEFKLDCKGLLFLFTLFAGICCIKVCWGLTSDGTSQEFVRCVQCCYRKECHYIWRDRASWMKCFHYHSLVCPTKSRITKKNYKTDFHEAKKKTHKILLWIQIKYPDINVRFGCRFRYQRKVEYWLWCK